MKFKSLKIQILVWFGGVTVAILLLFNFAFYYFLEENIKLSIQNKLYDKAVFINDNIKSSVPLKTLLEDKKLESFDIAIVKENKIIYTKGNLNFTELLPYIKEKNSFFVFKKEGTLNGLYIFKVYNPFVGAILFNEKDIDNEINEKLQEVKGIFLVLEPILLLLLLFVANRLVDKVLIPIVDITQTANKISVTDLSQIIKQPLADAEIKELVDSFNSMIQRLNSEVEHLEQFNSDVSHELKTPLTVIKGEIELSLNKIRDPEYYVKCLKTIEYESEQMENIVENLLMLTKYTKENVKETFQLVNLENILLETIDKYYLQLKDKKITLELEKYESIVIAANPSLITTIFSNLIDNAIKYSNENTTITIALFKKARIHFIITDQGIGIDENQLNKVMDRFYRVDESRNKKIKGFGLGLSIVKNSVELHGAIIKIDSKIEIGTKIEVII